MTFAPILIIAVMLTNGQALYGVVEDTKPKPETEQTIAYVVEPTHYKCPPEFIRSANAYLQRSTNSECHKKCGLIDLRHANKKQDACHTRCAKEWTSKQLVSSTIVKAFVDPLSVVSVTCAVEKGVAVYRMKR